MGSQYDPYRHGSATFFRKKSSTTPLIKHYSVNRKPKIFSVSKPYPNRNRNLKTVTEPITEKTLTVPALFKTHIIIYSKISLAPKQTCRCWKRQGVWVWSSAILDQKSHGIGNSEKSHGQYQVACFGKIAWWKVQTSVAWQTWSLLCCQWNEC